MQTSLWDGIPTHVLFAHFVVVLVPLAALAAVACAVWPPVLRRFGLVLPLLALVCVVLVPFTTGAGSWLEEHVPENGLVERHEEAGEGVLPWTVALLVVSVLLWWVYRRAMARAAVGGGAEDREPAGPHVLVRLLAVLLTLIIAAGAGYATYDAGHSGAKAAWHRPEQRRWGRQG
ncbi:hypothetical protein MUU72_31930 [Streptomyces sp. RS10V-4]|uniref:DUF2231 domain-containing protein n=1 Tax=Streptomyces rhizoryzae TaxID=2932493 RepID=UPI002004166A|nr:DUF2231 domain-containing protein [Streptomyces rhizoryzae]MCK7627652.1 hypothetical protein [Streptomyces rhizoryzae]